MDQDYVHKLSPEEKQWLSDFNEEYLAGNFKHGGKLLHKGKKLHRERWNANNARNRDLYSITNVNKLLEFVPDMFSEAKRPSLHPDGPTRDRVENAVIDTIDLKNKMAAKHLKTTRNGS